MSYSQTHEETLSPHIADTRCVLADYDHSHTHSPACNTSQARPIAMQNCAEYARWNTPNRAHYLSHVSVHR